MSAPDAELLALRVASEPDAWVHAPDGSPVPESTPASACAVYVLEPHTSADGGVHGVRLHDSSARVPAFLRDANPGNWHPLEWDELLAGSLGPWAMAVDGTRVVSLCHTPVPLSDQVGEAGVWTDPARRGRGLAAATTAVWTRVAHRPGRTLFYSCDVDNVSSQRVAARLGARSIGRQWRRFAPREPPRSVHPLSTLHRAAAPHPTAPTLQPVTADHLKMLGDAASEYAADGLRSLALLPEDPDAYLRALVRDRDGEDLPPNRVPQTTFVLRRGARVLGSTRVRHHLNDRLQLDGGHIGYEIRPSERRKGHGHTILREVLQFAARMRLPQVLLTAAEANLPSLRIIESAGGRPDGTTVSPNTGATMRRYWISTPTSGD